jgi:hypothetical protein
MRSRLAFSNALKRGHGPNLDGRYQKFLSDIAGQDVAAHGGKTIAERYEVFRLELPAMCASANLTLDELTFNDYGGQLEAWLKVNPQIAA